jgi:hypothetical protein
MYCGPYSAGVLHSVSDQIQNLQNCFTTPNKMTSKDDIKGLVSLKFFRPCNRVRGWGIRGDVGKGTTGGRGWWADWGRGRGRRGGGCNVRVNQI